MKKLTLLLLLVVLVAGGIAVYFHKAPAADTWTPPPVVTIESNQFVLRFPGSLTWMTPEHEEGTKALLLRDGDYIMLEHMSIRYRVTDGQKLKLTADDAIVHLGGAVVGVAVNKSDGLNWLTNATELQMKNIRSIEISGAAEEKAALERLASINRDIDVFWDESSKDPAPILSMFRPRLSLATVETAPVLATQPQVDTLIVNGSSRRIDFLAKFPKLHHLVITDWNPEDAGPLPSGLTQLETLAIAFADAITDLSPIAEAPSGLKELLITSSALRDVTGLNRFSALNTLILDSSKALDLSPLAALKQLRWAGLPSTTTQEQFAAFVATHRDLSVLEVEDAFCCDGLTSLAPLSGMNNLYGLFLPRLYPDVAVLQKLGTLRFVGISTDRPTVQEDIAEIRKALPDAMVVPVTPFCLGSGWIVLLVPAVVWAWLCHRRTRHIKKAA